MTQPKSRQTRRQLLQRTGGVALATVGTTGLATTSASAQTDSQGILADGITGDTESDFPAFMGGYLSRFAGVTGPPETVDALATDARNEFNANADLWVSYGNYLLEEMDVTGSGDSIVGVTFKLTRGRWPTRDDSRETAIDVGYDDATDQFTSLEWRDEEPDDPDFELTLENLAAENAADELSEFRTEWIGDDESEHEIPSDEYLNTMAGKYASSIGFGPESKGVLELFFGEVDI